MKQRKKQNKTKNSNEHNNTGFKITPSKTSAALESSIQTRPSLKKKKKKKKNKNHPESFKQENITQKIFYLILISSWSSLLSPNVQDLVLDAVPSFLVRDSFPASPSVVANQIRLYITTDKRFNFLPPPD